MSRRPSVSLALPPNVLAAFLAAALAASPVVAQSKAGNAPVVPPRDERAIVAASGIPSRAVGYVLYDLRTGKRLASKDADRLFVPASVAKVPTTIAALEILGGDYRFKTGLYATGGRTLVAQNPPGKTPTARPQGGAAFNGDLYLVGGGDPMLTADHMLDMVRELSVNGFERLAGRFYFDQSFLKAEERISTSQPEHVPHNSGVSALSVNFNRVRVNWTRRGRRGPVVTVTRSITDRMKIEVDTFKFTLGKRGGYRRHFTFAGFDAQEKWIMAPYIRGRGHAWLPVKRPAKTAAVVFREVARLNGVDLPKPRPAAKPQGARLVHSFESKPLTDAVRRVLYFSNNLATELVGLVAARKLDGAPMTMKAAARRLGTYLTVRMPKTNWSGFVLDNHSGLTLDSRMTPNQVLAMLVYAHRKQYGRWSYERMLKAYWLKKRARPVGRFSVRAKSGTINFVRGQAGYIRTPTGRQLAFVFFANEVEARNGLGGRVVRKGRRIGPRGWMRRARNLEHDLIAHWVRTY